MPELVGLLEKAELAVASVSRLADESKIAPLASATALLRKRLDYPDDIVLVALAGGTGSGKSSLLNAVAGVEVAMPGGVRPTTERPLAVGSRVSLDRINGYLSTLGVNETSVAEMPSWLCLIDLPDTDSVELDHRTQVDALVGKVDLVLWVVDPEKYRDASLHNDYLEPLSDHSPRFIFALNQIDRVDPAIRQRLLEDFSQALAEDGIEDARVIATSASPPAGPPIGIDHLLEVLEQRRGSRVYSKVLADLEDSVAALLESTGRSGIDFEVRARRAVEEASGLIAKGQSSGASDLLISLLEEVAAEVGGITADRIGALTTRIPRQVQQARETPEIGAVDRVIESTIMTPVREVLHERASAIALVTDLSLSVAMVRSRLGV